MRMTAVPAVVPDAFHLVQRLRLLPVQFIQKAAVHLFAVFLFPRGMYFQGAMNHILLAGHNVGEVAQTLSGMGRR